MKKLLLLSALLLICALVCNAQKIRPDAFPPIPDGGSDAKAIRMAQNVSEMANWDRYPTYGTYVEMMEGFASRYPAICRLDTIGTSVSGRLILCVKISDNVEVEEGDEPEFFYSSTMHGDEVAGFQLMLHLIDTLLNGYGNNDEYRDLINRVQIYINPLANPDGTYHYGNHTVSGSIRYNANYVDLNRNFPDPFGTAPLNAQQQENTAMIDYVSRHHFKLSANLHGGSEVMNYPWDSFRSSQRTHLNDNWFKAVCKRFVDTCRSVSSSCFTDVNQSGIINGGDWYVISNGRQDYMNYYHGCLEITMELSTVKTLSSDQLPTYWEVQHRSLVNYIKEIFNLPSNNSIDSGREEIFTALPNPCRNIVHLSRPVGKNGMLTDIQGKAIRQIEEGATIIDLSKYAQGIYILRNGDRCIKIVKQ